MACFSLQSSLGFHGLRATFASRAPPQGSNGGHPRWGVGSSPAAGSPAYVCQGAQGLIGAPWPGIQPSHPCHSCKPRAMVVLWRAPTVRLCIRCGLSLPCAACSDAHRSWRGWRGLCRAEHRSHAMWKHGHVWLSAVGEAGEVFARVRPCYRSRKLGELERSGPPRQADWGGLCWEPQIGPCHRISAVDGLVLSAPGCEDGTRLGSAGACWTVHSAALAPLSPAPHPRCLGQGPGDVYPRVTGGLPGTGARGLEMLWSPRPPLQTSGTGHSCPQAQAAGTGLLAVSSPGC